MLSLVTTPGFPDADALCESCGYPLRGLAPGGDCPECGRSIDASHPRHRVGPPWPTRPSVSAAGRTLLGLATRPGRMFRAMRIDGSNAPARTYLLGVTLLTGLLWGAGEAWALRTAWPLAAGYAAGAMALVLLSVYVEALGVAYFGRRRGWRVPMRVAERIVCYASPALLLAAVVLLKLRMALAAGLLPLPRWFLDLPGADLLLVVVPFAVSVLAFEALVWVGVRKMKYANGPV